MKLDIIRIYFLILAVTFQISCRNNKRINYYDNGIIKEVYEYENSQDTSTYEFRSYYQNGNVKEKGKVVNSKKEGAWEEYYMDGSHRRKTYYKQGSTDLFNKERNEPILIFMSDSLKIGVSTNIRAIDLYLEEGLGCIGGKIISAPNKDMFDFIVTPYKMDSIRFLYASPFQNETSDTLVVNASELKKTSEYGLSQTDIENNIPITIIKENMKIITLVSLPVYE